MFQRADILTIFALSKIFYRAQVLPLPASYATKFEKEISSFLWKGHMTRNVLSRDTVCLSKDHGGLGIPHIRLKCRSLFVKQIFRSITGNSRGRDFIDFWLGARLGLPQLSSSFFHLRGRPGRESDATPPLFLSALKFISKSLEEQHFLPTDIEDITTKNIYRCLLEDLPVPVIVHKHPDRNWSQTWKRLKSGVLSSEAKSFLYLLVHERVGTKECGHRLMPGRYPSSGCPNCGIVETINHRYCQCINVSEAWEWLRAKIVSLDISLDVTDDMEFLTLCFEMGLRENAILWLLGVFVEIVETEVVLRGNKLSVTSAKGIFKQRKQLSRHQAIPELGIILGLDTEGIG